MTEGKLVRDLIPELIRQSGRRADVRHLAGEELVGALGAKLREEAQEAAGALDSREKLIEELAEFMEVMSALMALHGIDQHKVIDAAQKKALCRGRFET